MRRGVQSFLMMGGEGGQRREGEREGGAELSDRERG